MSCKYSTSIEDAPQLSYARARQAVDAALNTMLLVKYLLTHCGISSLRGVCMPPPTHLTIRFVCVSTSNRALTGTHGPSVDGKCRKTSSGHTHSTHACVNMSTVVVVVALIRVLLPRCLSDRIVLLPSFLATQQEETTARMVAASDPIRQGVHTHTRTLCCTTSFHGIMMHL